MVLAPKKTLQTSVEGLNFLRTLPVVANDENMLESVEVRSRALPSRPDWQSRAKVEQVFTDGNAEDLPTNVAKLFSVPGKTQGFHRHSRCVGAASCRTVS